MSEEDKLKTNNEKVTINDYYYYYLLKCENALNELEKWIEEHKQYQLISERYIVWEDKLVNKLKALKENK